MRINPGLLLLLVLSGTHELTAQNTRAGQWRALREAKAGTVQAPPDSELKRILLRVEDSGFAELTELGVNGLYPIIGTTLQNSGFGGGVRYWRPRLGGSQTSLQGIAAVSTRLYQFYGLQLGRMKPDGADAYAFPLRARSLSPTPFEEARLERRNLFLYLDLQYRDMPSEPFFGLGNTSGEADESEYGLQAASYEVAAAWHVANRFGVGLRGGFLQFELDEGSGDDLRVQEVFEERDAPGLDRQPDFWHFGTLLWLDYRDHPTHPRLGGILAVGLDDYNDRGRKGFHFHRLRIESRHVVPLLSRQRLLAVRLLTSHDRARSGSRVPFYLMERLGGNDRLRGYPEGRFHDENLAYLSAEYRWLPAPAWELAVFYDTGKVYSASEDFEFSHLKKNWGFGVRFRNPNQVFIRIDVARSDEGTTFHFAFSPAF